MCTAYIQTACDEKFVWTVRTVKTEMKNWAESCAFFTVKMACCHSAATYVGSPGRVGVRRQGALVRSRARVSDKKTACKRMGVLDLGKALF